MFDTGSSIYDLFTSGKNDNELENDIINHLKNKKPEKEKLEKKTNENEDEKINENKMSNNNIKKQKIPDARYSEYQEKRNRLEEFVKKYDRRGYKY